MKALKLLGILAFTAPLLTNLALARAPYKSKVTIVKKNRQMPWSDNLQGVAFYDGTIYSQMERLWKFDRKGKLVKSKSLSQSLKNKGYHHYCDGDIYQNTLYLPLEGRGHRPNLLLKVDPSSLKTYAMAPLSKKIQHFFSWTAVRPNDGLIFSSEFNANKKNHLMIYREEFLEQGKFELILDSKLQITKKGRPYNVPRIQGGDFIGNTGHLALVSDTEKTGIIIVDSETGEAVQRIRINYKSDFPVYEELEGVEFRPSNRPGKIGTLRVIMLNNNLGPDTTTLIDVELFERN